MGRSSTSTRTGIGAARSTCLANGGGALWLKGSSFTAARFAARRAAFPRFAWLPGLCGVFAAAACGKHSACLSIGEAGAGVKRLRSGFKEPRLRAVREKLSSSGEGGGGAVGDGLREGSGVSGSRSHWSTPWLALQRACSTRGKASKSRRIMSYGENTRPVRVWRICAVSHCTARGCSSSVRRVLPFAQSPRPA